MFKKVRIALILLTLGFFLIPGFNYACNNGHSKEIAAKETKEKSNCVKECCQKNNSRKDKHNCDGKCRHANCTVSFQFNALTVNDFILEKNHFNFSAKKPNPHYNETGLSDGFSMIWLRPKIG
ncbi:hypothetical protein [Flavobacterium sp. HTF]|uniref:hypothetical protein n=1 Tax=Flavobacterium sp. HTF TaxID=2170732 RepID=UPI000D5ED9D6|nr:hypothetical protein [Flavobacterium sp. HTF]PWB22991.1 hypothetical protein DCO46_15730 [Flavobacterium sp. HTF]